MKLLKKLIIIFLSFMMGYHIFHTVFLYGFNMGETFMFSAIKDIVWIILTGIVLFLGKIFFKKFLKYWKWSLILLSLLVIWSLGLSFVEGSSIKMIFVGLKYDIFPLFLLLSGIFIGFFGVLGGNDLCLKDVENRRKGQNNNNLLLNNQHLWRFLYYIVCFMIMGGLIWQIGKIFLPDFFYWLGYGPVGDYVLGAKPPLYYRTGPGGVMRLQGFFSGPNNYGYFLVSFFSLFIIRNIHRTQSLDVIGKYTLFSLDFFFLFVFLFSCIRTLSRGVFVGITIQMFLLVWFFKKNRRKQLVRMGIFVFISLFILSIWKKGSTVLHFQLLMDGIDAFLDNPWGYGLGSAGPAIHRDGIYLPENHYLQLLLDIGFPGLILWMSVLGSILGNILGSLHIISVLKMKTLTKENTLFVLLLFGFIGLIVEGFFLHVLEDSMVNYLFLVIFGIVIGGISQKNVNK